jgi:hypothetical protein
LLKWTKGLTEGMICALMLTLLMGVSAVTRVQRPNTVGSTIVYGSSDWSYHERGGGGGGSGGGGSGGSWNQDYCLETLLLTGKIEMQKDLISLYFGGGKRLSYLYSVWVVSTINAIRLARYLGG